MQASGRNRQNSVITAYLLGKIAVRWRTSGWSHGIRGVVTISDALHAATAIFEYRGMEMDAAKRPPPFQTPHSMKKLVIRLSAKYLCDFIQCPAQIFVYLPLLLNFVN